MRKPKRNDPCPCGSGKKYKKCCGKNNVLEFNAGVFNKELDELSQGLIQFAFNHYESQIFERVKNYVESFLFDFDQEQEDTYVAMVTSWIIFNEPFEKGQTIFDLYYAKQQNKIKYARTKKIFSSWDQVKPSVFKIIAIDDQVKSAITIQDINTYKTYEFIYDHLTEESIGNFIIGMLIPYVHIHEFVVAMIEIPKEEEGLLDQILDHLDVHGMEINDVYPEFLGDVMNHITDDDMVEWMDPQYEMVAHVFINHMMKKNLDDEIIEVGILIWYMYCHKNIPYVQKPESYAAALEYFIQKEVIGNEHITQGQMAKEYGVSNSTISTNYRRFLYEFDDVDLANLQGVLLEESNKPSTFTDSNHPVTFNMEKEMRTIQKLIEGRDFASEEEVNEFLNDLLKNGELPTINETPRDIAQDLVEEARYKQGRARQELLERALEIYPNNPDAYILLAENESVPRKRQQLLRTAIEVGEKDLGADFFKENKGYFWGLVETRPYMRAKATYAMALDDHGFYDEAIEHYEELISLNPNDNQGIRYLLLPIYIEMESFDRAFKLLNDYQDDTSATFMFSRALVSFLTDGMNDQAYDLLKKAHEQNPFVLDYLLKRKKVSNHQMFDYMAMGEESEAIDYVQRNIHLWNGAEELLKLFAQK